VIQANPIQPAHRVGTHQIRPHQNWKKPSSATKVFFLPPACSWVWRQPRRFPRPKPWRSWRLCRSSFSPTARISPADRQGQKPGLTLYLEKTRAEAELAMLQKANPSLLAKLAAIPLGTMITKVKQLQLQLKDRSRTLVAPVISNPADRQQARLMLKQQGLSDKQIQAGLAVPVFSPSPF
jgi:hypothetical protein